MKEVRMSFVAEFIKNYLALRAISQTPVFNEDEDLTTENVDMPKSSLNITPLAPGQIRVLYDTHRPTVVALLKRWEDDSFVVTPFSYIPVPATNGELLLDSDAEETSVLQVWNTRTLSEKTLEKSYYLSDLPEKDITDAWSLWENHLSGKPVPEDILNRTALPIYKRKDPRNDYIKEELANFRQVDLLDLYRPRDVDVEILLTQGETALWNKKFREHYEQGHLDHAKACERADDAVREAKRRSQKAS